MTSDLEAAFAHFWRILDGPDLEAEYHFDPTRKWRFDFADDASRVAIELDGGTWTGGRHVRGDGYAKDCRKLNAAALAGWLVFRFTSDMIANDPAGHLEPVIGCIEVRRAQMAWLEAAVGSEA